MVEVEILAPSDVLDERRPGCAHTRKGIGETYLQRLGSGVTVKRRTPTEQECSLMSAFGSLADMSLRIRVVR